MTFSKSLKDILSLSGLSRSNFILVRLNLVPNGSSLSTISFHSRGKRGPDENGNHQ